MIGQDVDGGEMFEDLPELEAFAADLRQAAASAPAPRVGAALAAVLDGSMAPAPADITVPVGRRRLTSACPWAGAGAVDSTPGPGSGWSWPAAWPPWCS
jgi:hypothetical protein